MGNAIGRVLSRFTSRQRKLLLAGLALVAIAAGVPLGLSARNNGNGAIAAMLRDPMSIFRSRSPGARPEGVLLQTKKGLASVRRVRPGPEGTVPRERVLSSVRTRPPLPLLALPGAELGPEFFPQDLLPNIGTLDGTDLAGLGPNPYTNPGGPFGVPLIPPGGPGGATPDTDVPIPTSPVPEPATWMMMILGMGAIGGMLRRSRTSAAKGAGSAIIVPTARRDRVA